MQLFCRMTCCLLYTSSFDGDMTTRWSANGIGEWCVHDLGETKRIDAFGVALWMGAQRQFYFDRCV